MSIVIHMSPYRVSSTEGQDWMNARPRGLIAPVQEAIELWDL